MEITKYDIQEIILDGNNETFFNIASNLGLERIKCNADPDEPASIHWAASAGNTEVLEYLLSDEVKESANLLRANNFSPLHAAAMNGSYLSTTLTKHWEVWIY